MARPKGSSNGAASKKDGVAPYFRAIFKANPKLLKGRSNKVVLEQWLSDHPGHKEVPPNVKSGLANLKSNMRKSVRKRRVKKSEEAAAATGTAPAPVKMLSKTKADTRLEHLEVLIDESMSVARTLDREGLADIIGLLRKARNGVVWKLGGGDE
jgi:hypothetical protein